MLLNGYFFGRDAVAQCLRGFFWLFVAAVSVLVMSPLLVVALCNQLFAFCENDKRSEGAGAIWPLLFFVVLYFVFIRFLAVGV